jgi:hypothetical protein
MTNQKPAPSGDDSEPLPNRGDDATAWSPEQEIPDRATDPEAENATDPSKD